MLDTIHTIDTPEGVELQIKVAGPVVRALAWMVDFLIRIIVYIGLANVLPFLGELGVGLLLIAFFLLEWFYPVIFEIYYDGATPGKRIMGIKALHDNAQPMTWSGSLIRNLLRPVDFLPIFYGVGLTAMLFNQEFKRLGDLAASTIVVYNDEKLKAFDLPKADPTPLPIPLNLAEQHAIIHFAERAHTLSPERQAELANIISPLTNTEGQQTIQTLYGIANGLYGKHD
ncbi:RDD family protein [Candidatus Albibeggiatoa sp. nov. NOAA]|uniref:RDD family protein n=1 Tax=Candidatus Albibeggiatoa sp. nov. NOAA TaxID=3162724 RepID=UPI0032F557EB|nr:RDD family protein [Thiotrichaceae bacterium]